MLDDLRKHPYVQMVIKETLRPYPPFWLMSHMLLSSENICGFHFPAGVQVDFSFYAVHRHPTYWQNPEQFDPELLQGEGLVVFSL